MADNDQLPEELIVFVYRVEPTTHRYTPPLRLPMLDGTARYRVERIDPTPPEASGSPLDDALRAAGQGEGGCEAFVAHGAWLAHAGLPLPRMLAESALIYRFRRDTA